jgi:hypothetical protein
MSECRERVHVKEFAPFYYCALRRIDIESKGGILCNLLFLLIGGREGIAWIAESLSITAFSKRLEKLRYLLPPTDFGHFGN